MAQVFARMFLGEHWKQSSGPPAMKQIRAVAGFFMLLEREKFIL